MGQVPCSVWVTSRVAGRVRGAHVTRAGRVRGACGARAGRAWDACGAADDSGWEVVLGARVEELHAGCDLPREVFAPTPARARAGPQLVTHAYAACGAVFRTASE